MQFSEAYKKVLEEEFGIKDWTPDGKPRFSEIFLFDKYIAQEPIFRKGYDRGVVTKTSSIKTMSKDKMNTNSTVDNRERRKQLNCDYCPPNKGENEKRKPKSDKYKTKRKGR